MDFVNALILGLVQGLTEFLPVSSSAHIRIVGGLLGTGEDPGAAFTAIIQLGTELAVLVYFWRDVTHIIGNWFLALFGRIPRNDPQARLGWSPAISFSDLVTEMVMSDVNVMMRERGRNDLHG